ncbi:transcriptional repressor [Gordonia phage TillyBobJoe]|uniref:Immunity repressor n=1 Tax=Gordonia phage TillyBobJoe TaxID=2301560 RepID=A0A385DS55_9CAUD|nr:transcriptional repressor [Gordonia phage TillyBobJoe]AXQ62280.1 immunity repressor [Gordonia phage TillyBobJoe]
MTQRALCSALELSPPSVSKRVSGKHPFDLAEIEVVAETAGVSVVWLLTGLDTPSPDGDGDGHQSPLTGSNRRPLAYKVAAQPRTVIPVDFTRDTPTELPGIAA